VEQLVDRGQSVKVIVRSPKKLPLHLRNHKNVYITDASVLDLTDDELLQHVMGCNAVASCLGHNMSLKGMYGDPRRLVTEATIRLCNAIKVNKSEQKTKVVLMNTTGNSNRDLDERISVGQKCVIAIVRMLLPPHVDNEMAADYLRINIGQKDDAIEWVVVRPDTLTNEEKVTDYDSHKSPTRSAIFDSGKTSRINVSHFMAELISNDDKWNRWKGQMPVIYNTEIV
jgi:putative NADH-flavin reductase